MAGLSIESLTKVLLGLVSIAILISLAVLLKNAMNSGTDTSCAAAVQSRGVLFSALESDPGVPLKGCDTRIRSFNSLTAEEEVRKTIYDDTAWCYSSFGSYKNMRLVDWGETLCHVCAIYKQPGAKYKNIDEEITSAMKIFFTDKKKPAANDKISKLQSFTIVETDNKPDVIYDFNNWVALMFVQTAQADYNDLNLIEMLFENPSRGAFIGGSTGSVLGGLAAGATVVFLLGNPAGWFTTTIFVIGTASGAVTGVASGATVGFIAGQIINPVSGVTNTMVLKKYDAEELTNLGCTITVFPVDN